jgi:hypothetical protein
MYLLLLGRTTLSQELDYSPDSTFLTSDQNVNLDVWDPKRNVDALLFVELHFHR